MGGGIALAEQHELSGESELRARARTALIVNADDYGLTAGVNRAIEKACLAGIVTSTTVLANGEAVADVSALPGACIAMSIGVHVNLTLGRPVSDPGRVPTLVDPDGFFHARTTLMKQVLLRRVAMDEVVREASAQVRALIELGISPSHWDTHQHVADIPQLARAIAVATLDAGILRTRTPRMWLASDGAARWRSRTSSPRRIGGEIVREASRRLLSRRFLMPDYRTAANVIDAPGTTYDQRWLIALTQLPVGTCEVVMHPGSVDDRLRALTPRLTDERVADLAVATRPEIRAALADAGVVLIPFSRL